MALAELDGSDLLKFHPEAYLATSIKHFPPENPTQLYMTLFVELENQVRKFLLKIKFKIIFKLKKATENIETVLDKITKSLRFPYILRLDAWFISKKGQDAKATYRLVYPNTR